MTTFESFKKQAIASMSPAPHPHSSSMNLWVLYTMAKVYLFLVNMGVSASLFAYGVLDDL